MTDLHEEYTQVSMFTADNLRTMALSLVEANVSRLTLPEVESVVGKVARLVPAGNVPGMILNGLARLPGLKLPKKTVKRDINLLFKGVEKTLDAAVYSAFFAGPAAVIWGYQNLIKLAGKNPEDAFPEGAWQFYVDYSMREDTARHSNETHGFDTALNQQQIRLPAEDRITAWLMAAIHCLHQYDNLLANEWRERVYTALLADLSQDTPDAARYARLYRIWEKQRPYGIDPEKTKDSYPLYRRRTFDRFLAKQTQALPAALRDRWVMQIRRAEVESRPAYQRQMSILAYLESGPYGEERIPISLEQAHVGVIHQERYFLIPACEPGSSHPAKVETVRAQVAHVLAGSSNATPPPAGLAELKRANWPALRRSLRPKLVAELDKLRQAPILLNCTANPPRLPLSELRRTERGLGDHALTIFDTGATFVFDQSHIFFDGGWGAALAEILTGSALNWAVTLSKLSGVPESAVARPQPLDFDFQPAELAVVRRAPRVTPEVGAEVEVVDVKAIQKLRRVFKQRNDLLNLTVNDLLILYRAIHAVTYQPEPSIIVALNTLTRDKTSREAARAGLEVLQQSSRLNPAIVIPVDGSHSQPRDRLYPFTFEVPLQEFDLPILHQQVVDALNVYRQAVENRGRAYAEFDHLQRDYLGILAGLGELLTQAKAVARAGESTSMGALKLMAHLPVPIQRLLDQVPDKFDVLNDLLKGREVFSNVGAVAPTSSLTRFISAKDDNEKKTLVWGVLTDAESVMRLTLRDFRPHVGLLVGCGQRDLAGRMARHYLKSYAYGLNQFIHDLLQVALASRETQLRRPEPNND